ncbi:5-oxoprolinase subunit PxpB [Pseudooceanicola sp. CBS1P-1]|uniref:5-oxoprolinase subunit PxpB n=1 Tax=Pseudooceanicola albus TaxID=2692189 RepID=A0A6L7G4X2_9RHOB|nr:MULTISPECIES: 5-oxoprolinase subunit PxpB [Pseudooceanicola]MBT9386181.1 5-oxoprolinase subunit PxpB [Pseudooceanicola endophyticus]MXN19404.1 5-oxoprolinase subunit PxpB [Pseudooceanicola albus]
MADHPLSISWLGEAALLAQTPGPMSLEVQRRVWTLERQLAPLPGVADTVLGVHSVLVMMTDDADPEALIARLHAFWSNATADPRPGRLIEVPVSYGGDTGPDLGPVADHHGLSPRALAERHAAGTYTVFALGSQPGFAYLGGLDPALATPRLDSPRLHVEAGSVVIGGAQAGVISCSSPSGWHIIGRTETVFFDPNRAEPALLAPGDRLRFVLQEVRP